MVYPTFLNKLRILSMAILVIAVINIIIMFMMAANEVVGSRGYFDINQYFETINTYYTRYFDILLLSVSLFVVSISLYIYIKHQISQLMKLILHYIKIARSNEISIRDLANKLDINERDLEKIVIANIDYLMKKIGHRLEYDISTGTIHKSLSVEESIGVVQHTKPEYTVPAYSTQPKATATSPNVMSPSHTSDEEPTALASPQPSSSESSVKGEETALADTIHSNVFGAEKKSDEEEEYLKKLHEILGKKEKKEEDKEEYEEDETRVYA